MKTKLLFTAALMAATVGTQAVPNTGSSMLVQLLESQRLENNVAVLAEEAEESSLVDVSWYYIPNAKMTWLSGKNASGNDVMVDNDMAWTTDTKGQGWNYRVYALSTDPNADASKGDCPYPNGVERYIPTDQQYAANTKVLYQDLTGIPNGTYTVTLYAESRHLIDGKPHEGGLFVYANDVDTEITNGGGLMLYTLNNVQVTDGTLSLGVKTKDNPSADNHVVMAGVSLLSENDVEGLDAASESAPLDVTNAVTNAQCQATLGWRAGAGLGLGLIRADVYPNLTTEDYEGSGIEVWQSNNSAKDVNVISQTLGGLPDGKYRLSVCAFGRNQGISGEPIVENQLFVFANENQVAITQPKWEQISIDVTLTGGQDLVFGLYANAENTNNWQGISNVKLQYLGNVDLSELQAVYEELRANAANYEGRIPTAYYALLNNKVVEEETEAGYNAVITELRSMIATAESMVTPYADYSTLKPAVSTFNNETVAPEKAEQAVSTALDAADKATSVAALYTAVEDLWSATRTYAAAVTDLADGVEQTDVTFLAQNMDFASNDVAPWTRTVDNSGGNFRMMAPDTENLKYDGRFLESYVNTGKVAANANLKLVYQTLTGMPVGGYTFQARAFNRDAWFNDGRTLNPILLYVNNGETEADSRTLETVFTVNGASGDGVVEFGLKSPADFNSDWNGIADAHLYYTGAAEDLALSENDATYEVAGTVANVTLTRNLKAEAWNTFCVPFDMTADQLAANGITDVRALESASVEGTSVTLNFSESSLTAVEAGVPYLVKVTDYDGTINVENAVMAAAPGAVTVDGVTMTGNYAAGTVPVGAYFISNNAFYYADAASNVALKGFRAYINVAGTSEAAGANRLMINLDGEVTGIEDVLGEEAAEADKLVNVVSLDGMTVKTGVKKSEALDGLQKGIYIVDGKKYVVK